MEKRGVTEANLRCSFCGKSREQVRKLIAGPTVYIFDECVGLCNEIMAEEWQEAKAAIVSKLRKPAEIHHHLDQYVIHQTQAKKSSRSPCTTTTNVSPPLEPATWNCKKATF